MCWLLTRYDKRADQIYVSFKIYCTKLIDFFFKLHALLEMCRSNQTYIFFVLFFKLSFMLLWRTCNHTHFVNIDMAKQNINFNLLLTKGFQWGPPQTFFYTVLLQNFEVAHIINPLSEANQN
jgi:hypothetical protein